MALLQIARLRQAVAVLGRGGSYKLASEVLQQLSVAEREAGMSAAALRRAWHAAALTRLDETPLDRAQSLIVLGSLLLDTGAAESARSAAALAAEEGRTITDHSRQLVLGLAAVLAGMASRALGQVREAARALHEGRERLVIAQCGAGAALALVELGMLDLEDGELPRAQLCFAYAASFYRQAGDPLAAARMATAVVGLFTARQRWSEAGTLAQQGISDARAAEDAPLLARLSSQHADCLLRVGPPAAAATAAADAAMYCSALAPEEAGAHLLQIESRVRLACLDSGNEDALRQLEAAFDLALRKLDEASLTELLDWTVSAMVSGSLSGRGWELLERLADELADKGLSHLAGMARLALRDLRKN